MSRLSVDVLSVALGVVVLSVQRDTAEKREKLDEALGLPKGAHCLNDELHGLIMLNKV